jgi:hypothetical protein
MAFLNKFTFYILGIGSSTTNSQAGEPPLVGCNNNTNNSNNNNNNNEKLCNRLLVRKQNIFIYIRTVQ